MSANPSTRPAPVPIPSSGRILPAVLLALAAVAVIGLSVAALSGVFNADRASVAAAPTAITPVQSSPAPPPAADRQALNAALQQAISDNRIIAPVDSNAMSALRDLIALDPKDRDAQTTLLELFPFAVQAIEGSLERGELDLAEAQIELLGQTGHSSNSLLLLSEKLREQRMATDRSEYLGDRAEVVAAGASPVAIDRQARQAGPAAGSASIAADVASPLAGAGQTLPAANRTPGASTSGATPGTVPPSTSTAEANGDTARRVAAPAPASGSASPPLAATASPVQTVPVQIAFADPIYPSRARSRRIEGEVELAFTIDRNGEPRDIQVVRAEPPNTFDREALRAAQRWRFEPGTVNGQPVEQRSSRVLRFRLGEG